MPIACVNPEHPYELTAPGPYAARPAKDGDESWPLWYVANDGRRNVLRFPGSGGAVLTSRDIAERIAASENAKGGAG